MESTSLSTDPSSIEGYFLHPIPGSPLDPLMGYFQEGLPAMVYGGLPYRYQRGDSGKTYFVLDTKQMFPQQKLALKLFYRDQIKTYQSDWSGLDLPPDVSERLEDDPSQRTLFMGGYLTKEPPGAPIIFVMQDPAISAEYLPNDFWEEVVRRVVNRGILQVRRTQFDPSHRRARLIELPSLGADYEG